MKFISKKKNAVKRHCRDNIHCTNLYFTINNYWLNGVHDFLYKISDQVLQMHNTTITMKLYILPFVDSL